MTGSDSYRTDYEFLVKSVRGIAWEADPRTFRFTFVSENAEPILGFAAEEWLSEGFWVNHIHPDDRERIVDACRRAVLEGQHHEFEYRMLHADGHAVWFRNTFLVNIHDGSPSHLRGVLIDISAEEALRNSERLLRLVAGSAKDAIFRYGNNPFTCEYMSPAVAAITGYTPEEYYLNPELPWNIVHPQDQHLLTTSALIAPSGEPVVLRIIRKDGRVIWTEHHNAAVYDESGQVVAIEGTIRDISERITLEAKLSQAQKMDAIGRLAGGVAHDFNNMLTVVLSYSALALQNIRAEDPLRLHIEGIRRAAERAAMLTRQLTALSRRQFRVPSILDPNIVVEDMKGMLGRLIGEQIDFTTALNPAVGHIKADLSQIEQVVLNLVINARDAMPNGGKLTIETYPDGPYAVLAVSDTGTGIDPETLEHVFEPFFTTKPEGSGVGLATVYGIATQNGGDVSVETEVGAGTTFRVLFPRTNAAVTKLETVRPLFVKASLHETVLLVEDDDEVRAATAQTLETEGYRVYTAKTAGEALKIYQSSAVPVDLLLADLVLTDMDGGELAARISALKRRTAVLFMSGYSDRELARHRNLDFDRAFIRKPFQPKELIEKMRLVLDTLAS